MVRILSEMEKCTSNINLTDDHLVTEKTDQRERDTSYHKAKQSPF